MKCRRRMANSTGSARAFGLWAAGGGEAFGEGTADAGKEEWLMDEGVVDGFEEVLEDLEDAGNGNVGCGVEFCD